MITIAEDSGAAQSPIRPISTKIPGWGSNPFTRFRLDLDRQIAGDIPGFGPCFLTE